MQYDSNVNVVKWKWNLFFLFLTAFNISAHPSFQPLDDPHEDEVLLARVGADRAEEGAQHVGRHCREEHPLPAESLGRAAAGDLREGKRRN